MVKKAFFPLFLILFPLALLAQQGAYIDQNVSISGKAESYANTEIQVFGYDDQISMTETVLGAAKVDENGNFSFSFPVGKTRLTFFNLGVFRLYMYMQPGENYTISLPLRHEKSPAEEMNPFFQPEELYMQFEQDTLAGEINALIRRFDSQYSQYIETQFVEILQKGYRSKVDEKIAAWDSLYAGVNNPFFKNYLKYKFAELRHMAYQRSGEAVREKYFAHQPVLYHNDAYMNLFKKASKDYISSFSRSKEHKDFPATIAQGDYQGAMEFLRQDPALTNDTLKELVLLKGLYDAFFNNFLPKNKVLGMVQVLQKESPIAYHQTIAKNIYTKLEKLMPNKPAPTFELKSAKGEKVKLEHFKGRFVYLNFQDAQSYASLKEMALLKAFHDKYAKYFDIVTISVGNDFQAMKKLAKENNYQWTILNLGQNAKLTEQYRAKAFPTYFLIHPDQSLLFSPAPSPTEGFEEKFGAVWQKWNIEQKRKQSRGR